LEQLRVRLKVEPWRAALLEQVRRDAGEGNPTAAAVTYALTGERAYGDQVRSHLLSEARNFPASRAGAQYPWGPGAGDAIALDLVAPVMSGEEQTRVTAYLRQLALDAIQDHEKRPLTPNMSFVCHWRTGLIGYAIADQRIIEWAINDPGPPW